MFNKSLIVALFVLFLSISSFIYPDSDPPTYEYLVTLYPEILFEDLENYNYTIEVHGNDFYLVKINGVYYVVKA